MDPRGLEALHLKLDALHRKVDALLAKGSRDGAEPFCEAVVASYGSGPFYACDLLEWMAPTYRGELRDATMALCRTDRLPTPRQLGIALRRLADTPSTWFRVEAEDARGTTQWTVRDLRE